MLRLGIAGGGIGGSALISLLRGDSNTHLVGIFENKHEASGVVLARKWNIPVFADLESFVTASPDVVVNVTGDTEISNKIRAVSKNRVEVIEGVGARFLWEIIEKQKRAKIEVIKTMADQKILYGLAAQLCSPSSLSEFFEIILAKALVIVDAPAGSIAVYEGGQMKLAASRGLSKRFLENNSWNISGGITEQVFHTKEFVEINDILNCNYTNNPALVAEKIKSVLASPILLRGGFAGILYINDFKPRQFSERQKASLALLTSIIAVALDRFTLLKGLEEFRLKFLSLLEASNDILFMTDSNGFVITCNESAALQLGYSRDELLGKMITSLIKNGDTEGSVKNLLAKKTPLTGFEVTVIDAKNREFEVKLNAAPLHDKGNNFLGMIYVLHSLEKELDLKNSLEKKTRELEELNTNLEKMVLQRTDELGKTNRALERMNQLKGRFISNISHELRTPLNSILGFSDILAEKTFGPLNENQERYIRNIYSAGTHLLELINNVLDIAKIEAGKYEMIYETFRVKELNEDVLNIMRPLADAKFIGMEAQMGDGIDLITGDRVKIKQVLYNLLANAIKFTPEGGKVEIRVDYVHNSNGHHVSVSETKADLLSFSVYDTGVGIGPEDKDRIFDEFEQVDTTLSREYGGAGLGLALSKKLVELHGGNISVESNPGEGSTFTFTIPVTSPVESEAEEEESEAISLNFPWMNEEAPLILVVEDDPATAELLTLHLTQAGYKVAHAYNGEEAIQKAKTMRPFAITLDVMLPKKDGWEVLQALKSESSTSEIPVIIHSVVDNKELAFALGAADYLMKPLDKSALLNKLEEINIARGKIANPTSILVIESEESVIDYFKEILEPQGFLIHSASTGKRGIELTHALRPSLILMDFVLADMVSFDVIKELKENPYTKNIPIFILTERDISVEDRMSLMGNIERIVSKQAFDAKELIDHIQELEVLYAKRAGLIDELTGVFSHRYFQIRLAQEVERATRYKLPLNLVLLDIDFFGKYIEGQGENYGNIVLKKVSELLRKNIRGSDVVVRYGGDAFAVILPNTVISAGLSLSNRFNAIIKNYPFLHEESQPKGKITASVGIVYLDGQSTEELILCAEKALASAITKGGDRVEVYGEQNEAKAIQL